MSNETLASRLDELEMRYAFQEETIRQLDEVIQEASADIGRLKDELKTVREQLKETLGPEAPPEEQVPPHY
jgi:SlyX protein|tara:strand:- start:55 stop:267 length:213 start_codon:yes stop_codon:yes gene_type:complete